MRDTQNREAYFYCSLVFVRGSEDPQPIIAEGIFSGSIAAHSKGHNGHGYDPIFYVTEYNATAAELEPDVKNKISHRGKALNELRNKLVNAKII